MNIVQLIINTVVQFLLAARCLFFFRFVRFCLLRNLKFLEKCQQITVCLSVQLGLGNNVNQLNPCRVTALQVISYHFQSTVSRDYCGDHSLHLYVPSFKVADLDPVLIDGMQI